MRHHLSKPSSCCVIARPVTVVALFLLAESAGAQTVTLQGVIGAAQRCFQNLDPRACELTLDQAEELQRQAVVQEVYPCQTLLLGLQADLILQRLGNGRGAAAVADLKDIGQGCAGL